MTLKEIIQNAQAANVTKLLTVSGSLSDLKQVVEITKYNEGVFGALGVHPHDASKITEEDFEYIQNNCQTPKISAIGEIGLDYFYEYSPREIQKEVFIRFLKMATDFKRPVVIHTRDAEVDTMEILSHFGSSLKGVVHCFTGSLELAKFILEKCPHLSLGFTGVITFKNAEKIRDVVRATPLERIFIETDSPFMAPEPFRGKINQPSYIPIILKKVAEIKGISEEKALQVTSENSSYLFQEQIAYVY